MRKSVITRVWFCSPPVENSITFIKPPDLSVCMHDRFEDAIEDPDNPVIDVNASGTNVNSLLVQEGSRAPELIDGTIENELLYVDGLSEFLNGNKGAKLSEQPEILVRSTRGGSVYEIRVNDRPVESMPSQADDVLRALKAVKDESNIDPILDVYEEIIDSQVRRDLMRMMMKGIPNINEDRIEVTDRGWLIDSYYVVDWTASLYVTTDDPDESDYVRSGSDVKEVEKDHEFVNLRDSYSPERKKVKIDGDIVLVGEREMMFLSKVRWLLDRTQYHADEPFWRYTERQRKKHIRGK